VKGGETPPACAPPLSGGCVHPLGNCLTHLKPRVNTDGEGRRNSARLCITVIRHTSSPSLNHDPRVPKVPTERSSLQCSHGPLLSALLVPATTQATDAPTPEALTERGATPLPSAPVVPVATQVDGALTPEVPTERGSPHYGHTPLPSAPSASAPVPDGGVLMARTTAEALRALRRVSWAGPREPRFFLGDGAAVAIALNEVMVSPSSVCERAEVLGS